MQEPKIFDCFIFYNELELLELRLAELNETVDYFVIAEANKTHTGSSKEFIFEKNKDRFKEYLDKIIYVKVDDCPDFSKDRPPKIEYYQRNALMKGLIGLAKPGDKILISDLDEIPSPEFIKANLSKKDWVYLQLPLYYCFVNVQVTRSCGGTVMADFGTFTEFQDLRRFARRRYNFEPRRHPEVIPDSGWHYSYLFGNDPEKIRNKVKNIYESEGILPVLGNSDDIARKIKNHLDLFERISPKFEQKVVDIALTKPRSLDKFLEKYPHLFFRD